MKKFTLKSGNTTPFKKMGSSPAKNEGSPEHNKTFVKGHLSHSSKWYQENNPGVKEIDTKKYNPSEWVIMEDDKEKKYDSTTGEEIKDTETTEPVKEEEVKEDPIVAARKKEKEDKKKEKERKKKQRRIKKHTL
jgi:hypothetical protein